MSLFSSSECLVKDGALSFHVVLRGEMRIFVEQHKLTRLLAPSAPNHRQRHDVLRRHNLRRSHPTRILLNQIQWKLSPPSLPAVQGRQYLVVLPAFPTLQGPRAISLKQILIVAPFLRLSWPLTPHPRNEGLLRIRLVKTLNNHWVALPQLRPVPSA